MADDAGLSDLWNCLCCQIEAEMNCIRKWGRKKSGPFFDIMNLFRLGIVIYL